MKISNINDSKIRFKIIKLIKDIKKNNHLIKNTIDNKHITKFANILIEFTDIVLAKRLKLYSKELKTIKTSTKTTDKTRRNKTSCKTKKQNDKIKISHDGGFFFKNIEDNPNKPITGQDITKLLDEIQQFFYYAQYTREGEFLFNTSVVLDLLRGNTEQFKGYLNYRVFPQYYQYLPPFVKWDNIKKAYDEGIVSSAPDYLMAYNTWLKLKKEYLIEKGELSPTLSGDTFFDKVLQKTNDLAYEARLAKMQYKNGPLPASIV